VLPLLTALLWWGKLVSTSFTVKALSYVANHRRSRKTTQLAKTFALIMDTNHKKFRLIIVVCASLIAFTSLAFVALHDQFFCCVNCEFLLLKKVYH
jgi:hypothetical protein